MTPDTKEKLIKEIALPEATISLNTDGIIYVKYHKNVTIDVPLQRRMLEHFNDITGGNKMPFVFSALDGVVVTREARDNAIVMEGKTPILATAIIADNLAYRIIANFYVKVNKPKSPYKVFSKMTDALKWLKQIEKYTS